MKRGHRSDAGAPFVREERVYLISQLAHEFGLSRSTLLYYDRIGLLVPSGRTDAGYRLYAPADRARLEAICSFRRSGLTVEEIRTVLVEGDETVSILNQRLRKLGEEIKSLQMKQRLIAGMLKAHAAGSVPALVDKEMWVDMLSAAGMDGDAMCRWHSEFEKRAPESHHAFLLSLGIPQQDVLLIRERSAQGIAG